MNTTRQCSRCHNRDATRVLMSSARKTYFCDACEPTTLADFRRLVRLDDPIFAKPAAPAAVRDARDVQRIAELERLLERVKVDAGTLERQLADGARAFDRFKHEQQTTSDELAVRLANAVDRTKDCNTVIAARDARIVALLASLDVTGRQLRAAEFSSAQWEAKATEYKHECGTSIEKLGRVAAARDEAQSQLAQLRRQMQAERPTPVPVAPSSPLMADAPSRRRLTDLVASTIPLRGVRPLVVPPEMDLVFGVLPADNRSRVAQTIRDYLCGRRPPTRARGLDDSGRQLFTLGAGKFLITLALDDRDGFRIHELAAGAR